MAIAQAGNAVEDALSDATDAARSKLGMKKGGSTYFRFDWSDDISMVQCKHTEMQHCPLASWPLRRPRSGMHLVQEGSPCSDAPSLPAIDGRVTTRKLLVRTVLSRLSPSQLADPRPNRADRKNHLPPRGASPPGSTLLSVM